MGYIYLFIISRRSIMYPSHFSSIVRIAMWTFLSNKMIMYLTRFATILAINIGHGIQKGCRHGLHPNRGIKESKVIFHFFHGPHTKWTSITRSSILSKTCHVHHMSAFQSTKRFRRLKQCIMTDRTTTLQFLWNALMLLVIKRNTSIASHTVPKINSEATAQSASVTYNEEREVSRIYYKIGCFCCRCCKSIEQRARAVVSVNLQ